MIFYIFIAALCIGLSYFVNSDYQYRLKSKLGVLRQTGINRLVLCAIFFVLFFVSAIRVGTGNDYWVYRSNFLLIAGGDKKVSYELGFRLTVRLLQALFGTDCFRVIFAVFAFFTVLFSIKGIYENSDSFFMSVFIFMTSGYYFMSFSNVRYYFVFAIVIFSYKYLFEKRFVEFVLIILLAAFFHKTVLVVIPAFLIAYYLKWSKKTYWLIPAACTALIAGKSVIRWVLFKVYPFYDGDPLLDTSEISYVNIAKCLAVLVLGLLFYRKSVKGNQKAETLFNLNLFALILYSFAYYVPELTRICYYMVAGQLFFIPMVIGKIENKKQKRLISALVFAAYTAYFAVFLKRGNVPGINILPYLSWIFI